MTLQERDSRSIWHPFTPASAPPNIGIVRAEGVWLYAEDGRKFLDGTASWWVNAHGHAHPYITQCLAEQAQQLEHIIFAGFTHAPAVSLAERLLSLLNSHFDRIFYSDNGSTSVEVALKMALQFFKNRDVPKKRIIAFEHSYHGDTFGAMSVGHRNAFSAAFDELLFEVDFIPAPVSGMEEASIKQFKMLAKKNNVAAFIFEPLVQGAGGMRMYKPQTLNSMLRLCKFHGILSIADEVFTGFYRTGTAFASQQLHYTPDIICLSKTLTGGTLPLGVTAVPEFIYRAFQSKDPMHTFFHGHSFTANPLSCAAALASLDLFERKETRDRIGAIAMQHKKFHDALNGHPALIDVRCLGTILAIEFRTEAETGYLNPAGQEITEFFLARGIYLRPLGNVLYFTPPYCIRDEELNIVYAAIKELLETWKTL
ncbi:MAG: adenosylmethionine--8-amino-7-oxononanoate transaminase [Bacteroidia bacterium]